MTWAIGVVVWYLGALASYGLLSWINYGRLDAVDRWAVACWFVTIPLFILCLPFAYVKDRFKR